MSEIFEIFEKGNYKTLHFLQLNRKVVQKNKCRILISMRICLYRLVGGVHNIGLHLIYSLMCVVMDASEKHLLSLS